MSRKSNQAPQSTIGYDVAVRQSESHPSSYNERWMVDGAGNVIPRATASNVPAIRTEKNEDGTVNLYIPQLATGLAGYQPMPWATAGGDTPFYGMNNLAAPPESNTWGDSEYFGMWDTVLDQRDGKWDLRRALRWWRRDPVVYSCTKLLCQLANSRVTFKSEDDSAKLLIENWFKQTMPHSFRAQFFLEWYRSGYIPVMKGLVNYEPRNYKPGKIPRPGKGASITDRQLPVIKSSMAISSETNPEEAVQAAATLAAEQAIEDNTEAILQQNKLLADEYFKAAATLTDMEGRARIGLCSAARLDKYREDMNIKQFRWAKGKIAGGYTILSPLLVDLKGPATMGWLREPYLQISGDIIAAVMNPSPLQKTMLDMMPREIVDQIRDGATYVWLPPHLVNITCKEKQDYERYPLPMMAHCFDALQMKYDIHAMDQATVRGVKSRVLLVKVGTDMYPVSDMATLATVANIFNSVGRTGTFFWNHCIEMEWIEPDLTSFANEDKYRHCNQEIRAVYGVAPILVGQAESGGSIGNHVMNFKGVEQEVVAAQNAFLEFLQKEIRLLKAALNISAEVQADFERINMKDEMQFWTVVTNAVMNGILDNQTALETLGFHFPEVKNRMEQMQPLKKKGIFVPSPSANNLGPDGTMKPAAGAGGRQKNTKPPGKNKNKIGKSQPKKKAKAHMRAVGGEVFIQVEHEGEFGTDERQDVARMFQTQDDHVLTTAEFVHKFPDFDMNPDWPELQPFEVFAATVAANEIVADMHKRLDQSVATFKEQNPGKYVTNTTKSQLESLANIEATFDYLKAIAKTESLPTGWDKHFDTTKHTLVSQFPGMPADSLEANAFAMTALRYKKSMA